MTPLTTIWLQFALCAALIGLAGYQLSHYGDVIAQRTGMTGSWVGLALLATVTSLPELATGISSVTVANAPNLPHAMAWNKSFVGSLFVALATSLPELAVTLSALRMGALDMAISNLLGSNLFNVLIIAIDDLFYRPGPLLASVSPVHAVTAASAITMTGLALVGLFFKPRGRVLQAMSWVSLGLVTMYLLNTYVLYLYGE